ncbi:PiggyBac transposable element-derived protein 1 [Stylophora pistillata]|uniref:PiggyBac transposable element-derived protein 1 n=1 Tax=Stylophora pistillata TaxID=50429 RepID=A0A2B4T0R0_STYPI|nr:PiggyBac transposable element-derived protein 1 [Stylophora pistillata]
MAAASDQNDALFAQNSVQIEFVDEDDLPLANIMEHRLSDEDSDDDFELVLEEDEVNRTVPLPGVERNGNREWSRNINIRDNVDFNQPTAPRIEIEEDMKAVDFFQLYSTDAVWNHIVNQTNLYAEQKRGPEERSVWYALTVDEFKAWIALTLNMGIVNKPSLCLYWITEAVFKTPFFPGVMSRDRFLAVYNPERKLSIDETLIKFKGKIYFRQFIPIKPGGFGIKCFTLAEVSSGYGLVSKVYTGKENGVVQTDLGRRAVMGLMQSFLDKGHTHYMDNYYTSVPLFEDLEERGTLACGTARSNRKGLPWDITDAQNEEIKGLKPGESVYRQKGTITCVGWKDSKMVYMLATTPVSPTSNAEVESLAIQMPKSLMAKSFRNAPKMLQFRKAVVEQLVDDRTFRLTDRDPEPAAPIPHFRFNRDYFYHPISNGNRLACKVHIQRVDTQYSCAVCGVHMCPDPCFMRYHTMVDYHFNDESRQGPRRLAEPRGRPRTRPGRPTELRHNTQE